MTKPTTHSGYNKATYFKTYDSSVVNIFRRFQFLSFCLALDDGNVDEAHHIHISLMVDFVAEVSNSCLLFVMSLALWVVCKIIVNNFNAIQKWCSEFKLG